MKYAIFSDIHSNLQAYEVFLEFASKEGVDEYFCVGDIVGYGAHPHECIELTKGLRCHTVCGNHDWAASGRFNLAYLNDYAKQAVVWTQEALDEIEKSYLNNLESTYQSSELTLVHGSLDYPEDFEYIMDTAQAKRSLDLQLTPISFVGHTHRTGIFSENKSGYVQYTTVPRVSVQDEKRYLINVGSIGQPRDGDWRSSFCIYDNEKELISIKRIEYDVQKARAAILKAGLPRYLADRITRGR